MFPHLLTSFGGNISDNKVLAALGRISFWSQCFGFSAVWILMVLMIPNVHHPHYTAFWQCDLVRTCTVWELINDSCLGGNLFDSLQAQSSQLHGWEGCQILPIAPNKIINKSRMAETQSLLNFSFWNATARSLEFATRAQAQARKSMGTFVHDGPWCSRKHWN